MFSLICCLNKQNVIGKDNDLIYKIKDDLKRFKELTTNNVIVMGRKTFDSLPIKPLPNRVNIVLTSDLSFSHDNVLVCHSFDEVINICNEMFSDKECFIIGGGRVYDEALKLDIVNKMYLTEVDDDMEGNVYFPKFNLDEWEIFQRHGCHESNGIRFTYTDYVKKNM